MKNILIKLLFPFAFTFSYFGYKNFEKGEFDTAVDLYDITVKSRGAAEDYFNLGSAQYRVKQYENAIENFEIVIEIADDDNLLYKTHFNLGNSQYRLGEELRNDEACELWKAARDNYQEAEGLSGNDYEEEKADENDDFLRSEIKDHCGDEGSSNDGDGKGDGDSRSGSDDKDLGEEFEKEIERVLDESSESQQSLNESRASESNFGERDYNEPNW